MAEAGGEEGVGRPHFAPALVAAGAAESIDDAFDRYLADGRPGYVPKARLSRRRRGRLARGLGRGGRPGPPLQPGSRRRPTWPGLVGELADAGFAGIEAVYGRYSPRQRQALANLARRFDLVATGGSDYHGAIKPDLRVGTGTGRPQGARPGARAPGSPAPVAA